MTKPRLFFQEPKTVRDTLNQAIDIADIIHRSEQDLVEILRVIDQKRYYVRYGYYSLMGFCVKGLKFTRTQGRRIATAVRQPSSTELIVEQPSLNPDL